MLITLVDIAVKAKPLKLLRGALVVSKDGAGEGNRTRDLLFTKQLLYH